MEQGTYFALVARLESLALILTQELTETPDSYRHAASDEWVQVETCLKTIADGLREVSLRKPLAESSLPSLLTTFLRLSLCLQPLPSSSTVHTDDIPAPSNQHTYDLEPSPHLAIESVLSLAHTAEVEAASKAWKSEVLPGKSIGENVIALGVVRQVARVAANLCIDDDEIRAMLHTFQLPSTILQILFLYSAATDSLVVDGAVDSLRALIATVLNLVLGDYDPIKLFLIQSNTLTILLKLSNQLYTPFESQLQFQISNESSSEGLERLEGQANISEWIWKIIDECSRAESALELIQSSTIYFLFGPIQKAFNASSKKTISVEEANVKTSSSTLWKTDLQILTISIELLGSLAMSRPDLLKDFITSTGLSGMDGAQDGLKLIMDFLEFTSPPQLWLDSILLEDDDEDEDEDKGAGEAGSDNGETAPSPAITAEKTYSILKATLMKILVEIVGECDLGEGEYGWVWERLFAWMAGLGGEGEGEGEGGKGVERDDLISCGLLCFGNFARSESASESLLGLSSTYNILPTLLSLLTPSTEPKIQHALLGLLKNVSIPLRNKKILGDAGVIDRIVKMGVLEDRRDLLGSVQGGGIGVIKVLCGGQVKNCLKLLNQSPDDESESAIAQLLAVISRTDDIAIRCEATRVFTSSIKTLFGSEVATAEEKEEVEKAKIFVGDEKIVNAIFEMIRLGGKYPVLVGEGVLALALLSRMEIGARNVAQCLLTVSAKKASATEDTEDGEALTVTAPLDDLLGFVFPTQVESPSIPTEIASNIYLLLVTIRKSQRLEELVGEEAVRSLDLASKQVHDFVAQVKLEAVPPAQKASLADPQLLPVEKAGLDGEAESLKRSEDEESPIEQEPSPSLTNLLSQAVNHSTVASSIDFSSKHAQDYLSRLSSCDFPSLQLEPSRVQQEAEYVEGELTSLCFKEYKTFIDVHKCSDDVSLALTDFNEALDELLDAVPGLEQECRTFSDSTRGIQLDRRKATAVLDHQDKLVDLLDIPQLVDTCVRNGYYQEAMELSAHAKSLVQRYGDIPIVLSVQAEVASIMQMQLSQLLALLREPVKLPTLVKAVGFLRRMGGLTEEELRLTFLESREFNYKIQLEQLERDKVDRVRYARRYVDLFREIVYDTVSQYASIFLDPLAVSSTGPTDVDRNRAVNLIVLYGQRSITNLMAVIDENISYIPDTSSLSSLLTQLGYCAMSFSRIGMDFSALLAKPFENAVLQLTNKGIKDASRNLQLTFTEAEKAGRVPSTWMCTADALPSIMAAESSPPQFPDLNSSTVPPQFLSAYPPLAIYLNAVLTTLNSLRLLAPTAIFPHVYDDLHRSLTTVIRTFLDYANRHLSPLPKSPFTPSHVRKNTGVITQTAPSAEATEKRIREAKRVLCAYAGVLDSHVHVFLRKGLIEGVYAGECGKHEDMSDSVDFAAALHNLRTWLKENGKAAVVEESNTKDMTPALDEGAVMDEANVEPYKVADASVETDKSPEPALTEPADASEDVEPKVAKPDDVSTSREVPAVTQDLESKATSVEKTETPSVSQAEQTKEIPEAAPNLATEPSPSGQPDVNEATQEKTESSAVTEQAEDALSGESELVASSNIDLASEPSVGKDVETDRVEDAETATQIPAERTASPPSDEQENDSSAPTTLTTTSDATNSQASMTIIVAATVENGIGVNGGLPWHLPEEMKYFARVTTGQSAKSETSMNTVVMGRKTWESIPAKYQPLKKRRNLVISRTPESIDVSNAANTSAHDSIDSAIASIPSETTGRTFLIGGSQLYEQSLSLSSQTTDDENLRKPLVDRLLLTRILDPAYPECDVFFPSLLDPESKANDAFKERPWKQCGHEELSEWVGWDVKEGEIEEKGVKYRFEMWVR